MKVNLIQSSAVVTVGEMYFNLFQRLIRIMSKLSSSDSVGLLSVVLKFPQKYRQADARKVFGQ